MANLLKSVTKFSYQHYHETSNAQNLSDLSCHINHVMNFLNPHLAISWDCHPARSSGMGPGSWLPVTNRTIWFRRWGQPWPGWPSLTLDCVAGVVNFWLTYVRKTLEKPKTRDRHRARFPENEGKSIVSIGTYFFASDFSSNSAVTGTKIGVDFDS